MIYKMTYSGDVLTITKQELLDCLYGLNDAWNQAPHLSHEHSECVRYGEIINTLKERFNEHYQIVPGSAHNYCQVRQNLEINP